MNITNPRVLKLKGLLFLVLGLLATGLVLWRSPSWLTAGLLLIAIWAFCRFYYFAFYVLHHYADPNFKYTGLVDLLRYFLRPSKRNGINQTLPERPTDILLYSHKTNSAIVHLPGRKFPAVAIQGDSLSSWLYELCRRLETAKENGDEELYYELLPIAQTLKAHLIHYEDVLWEREFPKPYSMDVPLVHLDDDWHAK